MTRPPVRLVKHGQRAVTLHVGDQAATLTLAEWSELIAHPERKLSALGPRLQTVGAAVARPEA